MRTSQHIVSHQVAEPIVTRTVASAGLAQMTFPANTSFKSVRSHAPGHLQSIADEWQIELDQVNSEWEQRLEHQVSVHHGELLTEQQKRIKIQKLYESIQIEITQKASVYA